MLTKENIEAAISNIEEMYKKNYEGMLAKDFPAAIYELRDLAIKGLEEYVPYSTDERGYPHMTIDEKGRGKLLCLAPKNPTDSIVQHGI